MKNKTYTLSTVLTAVLAAVLAGAAAGVLTGLLHTALGIPSILAGILTQLILWSVNLKILGKANVPINSRKYDVLLSSIDNLSSILVALAFCAVIKLHYR